MSIHFVDALSRVGWSTQMPLEGDSGNLIIDPLLLGNANGQTKDPRTWPVPLQHQWADDWFHGKKVYQQPNASIPTIPLQFCIYGQGIGWRAGHDTGTYLVIVVLLLHILTAITYSIYVWYTGRTSDAWDSLTELLALAYTSSPLHGSLEKCGAGIYSWQSLKTAVTVGVLEDREHNGGDRLEMVVCHTRSIESGSDKALLRRPIISQAYG